MNHILTEHALKRCRKRKVQEKWIADTLSHPARTENNLDAQGHIVGIEILSISKRTLPTPIQIAA